MIYRTLRLFAVVGLLGGCSFPETPEPTPEELAAAKAVAARQAALKDWHKRRNALIDECYGNQEGAEYLAKGVADRLYKACEIDATIKVGAPPGSNVALRPAEPAQVSSPPMAKPERVAMASPDAVDRPGEVFDAYLCQDANAVGYDAAPGCEHFEKATVWIEALEDQGRARVRWNGQTSYTLAQRVLVNCRGTGTRIMSFWKDDAQRFDFSACPIG